MPRVEIHMSSTVSPERVRKAFIDFSPDRPKTWPGIAPELYEVYETGETWAEVREGSTMPGTSVWAREHYDWSDPETVRWTVKESNFCAVGSYVEATIRSDGGGGSTIEVTWNRQPTTFGARLMTAIIVGTRGMPIARSIRAGLATIKDG
jgi:hypothetical protein